MHTRRNRILVLDIDEQILMELERLLENEGFDTTTTWDSAEALAQVRTRHFDLLLVGDHPPEISGSEMLRELQCSRVSVPCVILKTGSTPFDPEYFYSLGASGVIADWKTAGEWLRARFASPRASVAV